MSRIDLQRAAEIRNGTVVVAFMIAVNDPELNIGLCKVRRNIDGPGEVRDGAVRIASIRPRQRTAHHKSIGESPATQLSSCDQSRAGLVRRRLLRECAVGAI